jgi:hypothetical protein
MAVDISGLSYFMPIFGFLFVFVIVYALLKKTELLGESSFVNLLISFIVAIIFATLSSAQEYVQTVTPWFAVLMIALFFVLIIVGLSQQKISDIVGKEFALGFVAVLILIFVIAAIKVFPSVFGNAWSEVTKFVTLQSRIAGGIILLIIAGITAFILSKS